MDSSLLTSFPFVFKFHLSLFPWGGGGGGYFIHDEGYLNCFRKLLPIDFMMDVIPCDTANKLYKSISSEHFGATGMHEVCLLQTEIVSSKNSQLWH